jgi:tetratricopeptide (TPR) repeat protein
VKVLRLLTLRSELCALSAVLMLCALSPALCLAQSSPLPPGTTVPGDGSHQAQSSALQQAESAIEAQNYAAAAAQLETWLSAHPGDARALFDRGYVADAQGQTVDAVSWYRKAIAADPKQFESRLALGLILAGQGDMAGAREQLYAATRLEPNPPNPAAKAQAYRALAQILQKSDPIGARDALLEALKLTPETPADTLLAAQIADAAGDAGLAEQEYRKLLKEQPDAPQATAGLVHLLIQQKRYADAQPLVSSALQQHPNDVALNAQMAVILNAEGKQADALAVLRKLHTLEPANPDVAGMLADAEFQAGDLEGADALYQQLLAATPNDPGLLDSHAQILVRQQHFADALAVFQKAVAVRQDDVDAWSGIAFADSKLHRWTDELRALSMRSKFAPENPGSLFLWATAYDNLHQNKTAADYYHRFLAAAQGKFPDQEWQARHRLIALEK